MDWLDLLAVQGTQEFSPTPQFKSINSLALSFLYGPTLTSIHDYWKNHDSKSESHSLVSDSLQPHGLTVHGILQARILEWVGFPFSRGSS